MQHHSTWTMNATAVYLKNNKNLKLYHYNNYVRNIIIIMVTNFI